MRENVFRDIAVVEARELACTGSAAQSGALWARSLATWGDVVASHSRVAAFVAGEAEVLSAVATVLAKHLIQVRCAPRLVVSMQWTRRQRWVKAGWRGIGFVAIWLSIGLGWAVHAAPPADPVWQIGPASGCQELVVDGDFEEISAEWTLSASADLPRYSADIAAASGSQSMQLGSLDPPNVAANGTIGQNIVLPAEATNIVLSFSYYPLYAGISDPGDLQYGEIIHQNTGQSLVTVLSGQLNMGTWLSSRYDLTALAGQPVRLIFGVHNDGRDGQMALFVDQVSILACDSVASSSPSNRTDLPTAAKPAPLSFPTSVSGPTVNRVATADCECSTNRYDCDDFRSWSVAQACMNRCKAAVGFDIHELDRDNDGLACELEIRGVTPFTTAVTSTEPRALPGENSPTPTIVLPTLAPTPLPAEVQPAAGTPLTMTGAGMTTTFPETTSDTESSPLSVEEPMATLQTILPWIIAVSIVSLLIAGGIWLSRLVRSRQQEA